jgi:cytidyltransferase-like protein
MGGTFDHMHLGHKLLLTQACLLTKDTLHVGITGDALLAKKAYS